jgi:hypothetical protein
MPTLSHSKLATIICTVLLIGIVQSAAADPSAMDQLRKAAGSESNRDHVFDGRRDKGDPPARTPTAPPVGPSTPVGSSDK